MKLLIRTLFLLFPILSFAQSPYSNFYQVDERAKYIPFTTPDSLTRQLTAPYTKDIQKVRAIFRWITENIAYNVKPANNRLAAGKNYIMDDPADTGALKPLSERVAIEVLQRRIAFCDGYARLFSTLCNYAGIESEVVTGYANGSLGRRKSRFGSNHRWNAVKIDSSWYLLDATWASGYVTYSDEFIRSYNDFYFLTSPKAFARDHYPEDPKWLLMTESPEISEFVYSPFKTHAFSTNNIVSYSPKPGIIEAALGDTVKFELEGRDAMVPVFVVDTTYIDSALLAGLKDMVSAKTWSKVSGKKATIYYVVNSTEPQWLNLIFEDKPAMRYKLNVRKLYTASTN